MAKKEVLKETDEWIENLKNLLPSVFSENQEYVQSRIELLERLREQVERVQGLEKRIKKELEYVSKYNVKLNEFLQKRKLPPNTLGRHVVEVIMNYVEELEQQNKCYQKAIKECVERMNEGGAGTRSFVYEKLIKVLEDGKE